MGRSRAGTTPARICRAFLTLALIASAPAARVEARGGAAAAQRREVAVTFDDLPATYGGLEDYRRITTRLLESVRRNRVPAVGFVNERKLYRRGETDARTELLRAWLDAGLELGNHTYSHINPQRAPLDEYKDDVVRGETVTRMLLSE